MEKLFHHFEQKMAAAGLTAPGAPLFGFLDADLLWSATRPEIDDLAPLLSTLSINSLLFARPAEPYATIIDVLADESGGIITPRDSETRTFLHDLPVAASLDPADTLPLLKQRKGAIVPGRGLLTYGTVSLEQAYITYSSICFACLVKFFSDYRSRVKSDTAPPGRRQIVRDALRALRPPDDTQRRLMTGPFNTDASVRRAMAEAGRLTVARRLVDSYFGNISYRLDNRLYISQTGSSLDNLEDCIDPCPLDGSTCAAITASSELSAHTRIIASTACRAILHGHPPFAVILSMDCDDADPDDCPHECHLNCPHERSVCGIPIVPGEVGTGPHGLCHTVPPAIIGRPGVIVYGHGLFSTGDSDFNRPFANLLRIETACRNEYITRAGLAT